MKLEGITIASRGTGGDMDCHVRKGSRGYEKVHKFFWFEWRNNEFSFVLEFAMVQSE